MYVGDIFLMIYLSPCIHCYANKDLTSVGKKALFSVLLFLSQIGSSPGFEDGEFQYAKLMRPAASFYHTSENCLYFVDLEVLPQLFKFTFPFDSLTFLILN